MKILMFIERLPNWVRWICIIPAILIANFCFLLVLDLLQLVSLLGSSIGASIPLSHELKSMFRNFGEPIIAVIVASHVAPNKKFFISLILIFCFFALDIFGLSVVVIDALMGLQVFDQPLMYLIVESIVGIAGTIFAFLYALSKTVKKQEPQKITSA